MYMEEGVRLKAQEGSDELVISTGESRREEGYTY